MQKRLKSKRGYTLAELLVVLAMTALVGIISLTAFQMVSKIKLQSRLQSHASSVKNTVFIIISDILRVSQYVGEEDGNVLFINEKYSGWNMSLEESGGRIYAVIHADPGAFNAGGERSEEIMTSASYAEFSVSDFDLSYTDGVYHCEFKLGCNEYSEDFAFNVYTLST